MQKKRLRDLILGIFLLIGGFLIGKSSNLNLEWDPKINIFSAISFVITTFIALIIIRHFDKKKTESRVEKDFLIDEVKKIEPLLNEVLTIIKIQKRITGETIVVKFKTIRQVVYNISELLKVANIAINEDSFIENFEKEIKNYQQLFDEKLRKVDGIIKNEPPLVIKNNICELGVENPQSQSR